MRQTRKAFSASCCLLAFMVLFVLSKMTASAKTVNYVKEYTYQASELDSKQSSRTISLEQVKRLLLEELGTYLISETTIKDFELTKDQISSLTAGVVMTVILDEKWDGKTYYLKARISAETDNLVKSLGAIRRNESQGQELSDARKKTEKALKEIEQLKNEIVKGQGEKVAQEKYAKAINELNAIDWFEKGYKLQYVDKNSQEAVKATDKAIDLDPRYASAYALKSSIYNAQGLYLEGLKVSEQAVKLDPTLAWGFNARGVSHTGLGNYREGIQDINKALELQPAYGWAYCNRSWAYYKLKDYDQALKDANRAIELNPELSQAYFRRGNALASLNKTEDAVKDFDKAVQLDPAFSWSYLVRGQALLKLNKPQQAQEDFKKAASLGNISAQRHLREKGVQR